MELQEATSHIEQITRVLFTRRIRLEPFDEAVCQLRLAVLISDLQVFYRTEEAEALPPLLGRVRELLEHFDSFPAGDGEFFNYLRETAAQLAFLQGQPPPERHAWRGRPLRAETLRIPGMITQDAMRYYQWLGERASGAGEAVEVGCWLGRTTACLAEGLAANRSFEGRRLHVFDKFTWDALLAKHVVDNWADFTPEAAATLASLRPGDSNLELFLEFCSAYRHVIEPHPCYIYREGESGTLPPPEWHGGPITLFVQDLTNNYELVRQIWDVFAPSFIPGETTVVFLQHGHPRAEGLRRFCQEHADELRAVHKPVGPAKGFLFTGRPPGAGPGGGGE